MHWTEEGRLVLSEMAPMDIDLRVFVRWLVTYAVSSRAFVSENDSFISAPVVDPDELFFSASNGLSWVDTILSCDS